MFLFMRVNGTGRRSFQFTRWHPQSHVLVSGGLERTGRKVRKGHMKRYNKNKQLEAVICNCCGKKLVVEKGIVREGVIGIDYNWDYFSEKDGQAHHFDLCEECYDQLTGGFKLPVEVEELTELL